MLECGFDECVQKRNDVSVPAAHGPELVTTGLIVRQYERPARSVYLVPRILADRTPACSTEYDRLSQQ